MPVGFRRPESGSACRLALASSLPCSASRVAELKSDSGEPTCGSCNRITSTVMYLPVMDLVNARWRRTKNLVHDGCRGSSLSYCPLSMHIERCMHSVDSKLPNACEGNVCLCIPGIALGAKIEFTEVAAEQARGSPLEKFVERRC